MKSKKDQAIHALVVISIGVVCVCIVGWVIYVLDAWLVPENFWHNAGCLF